MALPHSTNIMDYPARYQWQSGAPANGASCCTDACVQMIIEYYKERHVELDDIRRASGHTSGSLKGLTPKETLNALRHYGIDWYQVASGISPADAAKKTAYGPVIFGVHYGSYPKDHGGDCGRTNRAQRGGKTDCPFTGAHAVLGLRRLAVREKEVSKAQAIVDGARVRSGPGGSYALKGKLKVGDRVHVTDVVEGSYWSTTINGVKKTGTHWYKISSVNGVSCLLKYGKRRVYAATGLFKVLETTERLLRHDILSRDPDHHHIGYRNESPDRDRITQGQLHTAMVNLPKYTAWSKTYALYPTKKKRL